MKIYTKSGDNGNTHLYGGKTVSKADLRIESYGSVDELNSYIGLLRDMDKDTSRKELLKEIQDRLFTIGSSLAADPEKSDLKKPDLLESDVELLEKEIDKIQDQLPELKHFILPGGHQQVSFCHISRTVCRRSERLVVYLSEIEKVEPIIIMYLNRLSDFLFVLSRKIALENGVEEVAWKPRY